MVLGPGLGTTQYLGKDLVCVWGGVPTPFLSFCFLFWKMGAIILAWLLTLELL